MTLQSFINRLIQYASSLYYHQWTRWELVGVVAGVLVALLLARAGRRKLRAAEKHLREHSPIVGIHAVGHKRR